MPDEVTLQLVFSWQTAISLIGHLMMAVACGVLAVRHRSWAAWVATAGFACQTFHAAWDVIQWLAPEWEAARTLFWYLSLGTWSWEYGPLVLLVAALGFAVFVFRHERRRSGNSDRAA